MKLDLKKEIMIFDLKETEKLAQTLIQIAQQSITNEIQQLNIPSTIRSEWGVILKACIAFKTVLESVIFFNGGIKNANIGDNEEILKYGTALLFELRKLITGESLSFVIGGSTSKGVLKEKIISQEELFARADLSKIRVSFANAQIELSSALVSLRNMNKVKNNLANQWKKVLKYGFIKNIENETVNLNNEAGAFQKKEPDLNVYMRFATEGKRRTLTYYYMKGNERPNSRDEIKTMGYAYDRGWMYQWLKMNEDVMILDDSAYPLYDLMHGESSFRENHAGIQGGDSGLEQYKYQNRRIITLNNIYNILVGGSGYTGIIPLLQNGLFNLNKLSETLIQLSADFGSMNKPNIELFVQESVKEIDFKI